MPIPGGGTKIPKATWCRWKKTERTKILNSLAEFKSGLEMTEETANALETISICVKVAQWCPTLCDPMDYSLPGPSVHRDSPGKNTGVGCHALLQGIFPIQGSNPGLPHCRWTLPSEPPGKPTNYEEEKIIFKKI